MSTTSRPGSIWCIVVAAGSGERFGSAKQFAVLGDRRVVDHSVSTAATVCDGVVVVVPSGHAESVGFPGADQTVRGGATRSASVRAGIEALPDDVDIVLVHDAARPLASEALFRRVVTAVAGGVDAAVPAVAVTDTIRDIEGGVVDRDRLRAVQTPQGFRADVLRAVHASGSEATDDAGLVEAAGGTIELVDGERTNLKLTTTDDLGIAEALISRHGGGDSSS